MPYYTHSMSDENSELVKSIEIFSSDDAKLKTFAEIISNKSSNEILHLLFKEELTANEIAQKTGISLQLVKYHIEKMQSIDLVAISKVGKNSKSRDMNYYTASKFAIVITHTDVTEKAKQSKLLAKSFASIYRFFAMGAASVASVFSMMLVGTEGIAWPKIDLPFTRTAMAQIGAPNSVDESVYLAQKKVESVMYNPSSGSGTPYFDPYSSILPFETGELVTTMVVLSAIALALSLPFFLRSRKAKEPIPISRQPI